MALPQAYVDEFSEPAGFVNFASTGPVSARVRSASDEAFARLHQPAGDPVEPATAAYEAGRERIASFLGTTADGVTILPSTSAGIFQVAFGVGGGNVVVPAHEFPANVYPWLRAEARGGPEVRLVTAPGGRVTPDILAAAVDDETAAVAVSFVDYRTGFRADIAAIREMAGEALVMVDAIQGLGAVDFPAAAADVVVAGGQKWLRAGWAAGFMAASSRALERLAPTLSGWYGAADFLDLETPPPHPPRTDAERFQEGSPVLFGSIAAAVALDVIAIAGIAAIEQAVLERAAELCEVLESAGAELLAPWRHDAERAGIVSFRLPGEDPAATATRLRAAGLILSERGGWVRLAPHATTGDEAVAMVRSAL